MSHPENPAFDHLDTDYDDQVERLVDTLGISYADARDHVGVSDRPHLVRRPTATRTHHSRRGGRSYPEPSDSERDPDWNVGYEPLGPEQKEITRSGIALTRAIGELAATESFKALGPEDRHAAIEGLIADHYGKPTEE